MRVSLTINGKRLEIDATPNDRLADTLRANGCPSVKIGCGDGACGTCTVLLSGKPVVSCEILTVRADGAEIVTVEGLGSEAEKIVDCLIRAGAEGCGYCAPGFVMLAYALKQEYPTADYEQARMYLNGNLCRCTGYTVRVDVALEYLSMP